MNEGFRWVEEIGAGFVLSSDKKEKMLLFGRGVLEVESS